MPLHGYVVRMTGIGPPMPQRQESGKLVKNIYPCMLARKLFGGWAQK
jgi:hypothetical protein